MLLRTTKTAQVVSKKTWRRFFVVPIFPRVNAKNVELTRNSYLIMKIVLAGTMLAVCALLGILLLSYFFAGNTYVGVRIPIAVGIVLYLGLVGLFIKARKLYISGWLLILFYIVLSGFVLTAWGINIAIGGLTLGFTVILAGTVLGARYIIPVTVIIMLLFITIHTLSVINIIAPATSELSQPSDLVDLSGYIIVFSMFALVSWLSGRKMEQALEQALRAETALQEEKSLLAVRLEEQTQRL